MPSERKPRPSFVPDDSPSTAAEGRPTGWVYRSEADLEDPNRPAMLRWAGKVERGTARGAERVVRVASWPFELLMVLTLPFASWLDKGPRKSRH